MAGPPEDKTLKAKPERRCPNCHGQMRQYEGPSGHKLGRWECDVCRTYVG